MPLDFPSNPVNGQVYEDYYYDATIGAWQSTGGSARPDAFVNVTYTTAQTYLVPVISKGKLGQTADLQQWNNSLDNTLAKLTASGGFATKDRITISSDVSINTAARLFVNSFGTTEIPLIVKGIASQSADLQQWQNSAGSVVADIDPSGNIYTAGGVAATGNISGGIVTATNYKVNVQTAGSDTVALDFSTGNGLVTRTATGTITFTGANYSAGSTVTARIVPGGSSRTLNFPAGWVFVGGKPTSIAASKTGILTVTSFGTTEADCVASFVAQL